MKSCFNLVVLLASIAFLGACGNDADRKASQVVAKVNESEITIHQVNFALQSAPGLTAEQAPVARKQFLERLIEQEILVQQAELQRLDRDPRVLQTLEAARREVLARAYLERLAQGAAVPDAAAVKTFFSENPSLFAGRRVYRFDEVVLPRRPQDWEQLSDELGKTKSLAEAIKVLKSAGIDLPVASNVTRASEQLPLELAPKFAQIKVDDVVIYPMGNAVVVGQVKAIVSAPVAEDRAGPVILQFLKNRDRNALLQAEVKRLREAAQITYLGEFVEEAGRETKPAGAAGTGSGAKAGTSQSTGPAGSADPAAGVVKDNSLSEGIRGLR